MGYQLFFKFDLTGRVNLDGSSIAAPVKGARYAPGAGRRQVDELGRQVIDEVITVELSGSYAEISDWITALDVELETLKAGQWRDALWPFPVVCIEEPDAEDGESTPYWTSELLDAWLSVDPGGIAQRALGHQLVTINIKRLDRWKYTGGSEPDIIIGDLDYTQEQQGFVLNHFDTTDYHTNWGYVSLWDLTEGSLPAECVLTVETAKAGRSLGDIYLGCSWSDVSDPWLWKLLPTLQDAVFSAGAGVVRTSHASGDCADGSYCDFAWSSSGEVEICSTAIPVDVYKNDRGNGRPFKPLVRLHGGLAASDVLFKVKVKISGTSLVLSETDWTAYPSGAPIIELPPVYLMAQGLHQNAALVISLYAFRPSTTYYALNLDFMQLWPVDGGFRKLKALAYMAGAGLVCDDAEQNSVWWEGAGGATTRQACYYGLGQRIRLMPGKMNIISVINIAGGSSWLIDDELKITFNAAPVKRDI